MSNRLPVRILDAVAAGIRDDVVVVAAVVADDRERFAARSS